MRPHKIFIRIGTGLVVLFFALSMISFWERSHFRALALDIDCHQSRRSRLSRCWTAPEVFEVLRIASVAEFAGHRIGTLLLQPLSLTAQLPTFQVKRIDALALGIFVERQRF